ncbi:MAG: peptidylprolyl isomerase [bacterium]
MAGKVTEVVLETSSGEIVLEVLEDWSPLGSEHFLELVQAGFYDGAPWFRVIDNFVAQCGISANPEHNQGIGARTVKDEPLVEGNKRGYISFGRTGAPNSRSSHIFVNFKDNHFLDAQGFPAFARIKEGMEVADSLHRCEYDDQYGLQQPGGIDVFKDMFPEADYILKAYVRE